MKKHIFSLINSLNYVFRLFCLIKQKSNKSKFCNLQMADFTFLFNRKGALYPLDLYSPNSAVVTSASPHLMSKKLSEWPFNGLLDASLVNLCCKTIVNFPIVHLDKLADEIPAELFVPLFKAALYPVKDSAIDVLINKWPYKSLIVSKFISNMFTSMVILYSDTEMGQRTRLGKLHD